MCIKFTHQCKGTQNNHDKNHICQIVANRDMGRVKELIKDSKYFCKNCGVLLILLTTYVILQKYDIRKFY